MGVLSGLKSRFSGFRLDRRLLWQAILAAPVSIVLHEMGHAFFAYCAGYSGLYITFHSWGGQSPIGVSSIDRAWICAGGPIASFIIVVVCVFFTYYRPGFGFSWVLGFLAPVQFMGALFYVLGAFLGAGVSTAFNSARVAYQLGLSVFVASVRGSFVLVGSWLFFIRSLGVDSRRGKVLSILVGGFIGFLLWLTLFGPLVLPD